ncbi:MAG TPA: ABC transporter ATP-binding protein, partial [Paracoccus sp.]|nr:ABC transporter ATP-binding protein [Paracoccus sp. (in: a-proteobacteria)]
MLDGARDIRLYQIQHFHEVRFADAAKKVRQRNIRLYRTSVYGWSSGVDFVASMILLGPVLLGVWLHLDPAQSVPPELIPAVLTYAALMASNLRSFDRGLQAMAFLGHALDRLETVIAYPEEPHQPSPALEAMPDDQTLRLIDLGQRYGSRTILKRFDLDVAAGEKIALTGPSGVGKTTLANLILRLEEPTTGCVMLGGQPAHHFPLPMYLSYFAHVGHHTHLFHASLHDNIAMGWRHVPFADIERAARLVRLHDAICRLPQGYDTIVGTGDLHLSQGQR